MEASPCGACGNEHITLRGGLSRHNKPQANGSQPNMVSPIAWEWSHWCEAKHCQHVGQALSINTRQVDLTYIVRKGVDQYMEMVTLVTTVPKIHDGRLPDD